MGQKREPPPQGPRNAPFLPVSPAAAALVFMIVVTRTAAGQGTAKPGIPRASRGPFPRMTHDPRPPAPGPAIPNGAQDGKASLSVDPLSPTGV